MALPEVPLRSVTASVDAGFDDALLVCGARAGDDLPVVCLLDESGACNKMMVLPHSSPVAAWPMLLATSAADGASARRYVVWAAGSLLQATVWLAKVQPNGLSDPVRLLDAVGTLGFHVSAAASAIDVLCYGEVLDFVRWRSAAVEVRRRLQTTNDSAAGLLAGAVFWPTAAHTFDIWDVGADSLRKLKLPEPPERASAQARHLRLVSAPGQPDLLYWETQLPDDFHVRLDDGSRQVTHGFSVRAWLATLDRTRWQVGVPSELPPSATPPLIAWVDGRLAVVRALSGTVEVMLGERA